MLRLKVLADPRRPAGAHIAGHAGGVVALQVRLAAEEALLAQAHHVVGVDRFEVAGNVVDPVLDGSQAVCEGVLISAQHCQ